MKHGIQGIAMNSLHSSKMLNIGNEKKILTMFCLLTKTSSKESIILLVGNVNPL